jgi:predicted amidophosphoribosyltransferase
VAENACHICDQALKANGECGNPICNWPVSDRFFELVWAISMRTGQMKHAISRYKYDGKWGWAGIFGRILVGFLNEYSEAFEDFDYITPSPTFVDAEVGRPWDHIGLIVEGAQIVEPIRWPFAFDLIVGHTWRERRTIAEGRSAALWRCPIASRSTGRASSSSMTCSPRASRSGR